MTCPISLLSDDWNRTIERLGGAEALAMGARNTKAFAWGRKIPSPIVLLRLVLAYCLGKCSLRSTTTWATAIGLADISNVALLYRLRRCGDWLALLVGHLLAMRTPKASRGRLIRIIDASSVPKAGRAAKRENGVWRIHSAFDLPSERFGQFVLTDEHGGEQLDRIAVVRGEIRLADRVHLQPDRIANVLADGGDVVVRAAWKNARWQQRNDEPLDLLGMLGKCKTDRIDEPVWIGHRNGPTLALRLIAARKSEADAARVAAKACPREGVTSRRKWRLGSPLGESQMQHAAEIGSPSAVAGESGVDSLCECPPRLEGEGDPCRQPRLHRFNFRLTMTAN